MKIVIIRESDEAPLTNSQEIWIRDKITSAHFASRFEFIFTGVE